MRDLTIEEFAARLAARTAAPGGGAAAAYQLAFGAGLVAMLARFSEDAAEIADEADEIRAAALGLADDDVAAYARVLSAYRLDRADPGRSAAIGLALAAAAGPPAAVIQAAGRVIALAERLVPHGNRNVITDAAAGVQAARAAIVTSRVNIATNLTAETDPLVRKEFSATVDQVDGLLDRADALTALVLTSIG